MHGCSPPPALFHDEKLLFNVSPTSHIRNISDLLCQAGEMLGSLIQIDDVDDVDDDDNDDDDDDVVVQDRLLSSDDSQ